MFARRTEFLVGTILFTDISDLAAEFSKDPNTFEVASPPSDAVGSSRVGQTDAITGMRGARGRKIASPCARSPTLGFAQMVQEDAAPLIYGKYRCKSSTPGPLARTSKPVPTIAFSSREAALTLPF